MEALPLVTFLHRGPLPQPATPRRGHWGHPGNCHEQSLFFTYEGLYALHNFTVLLPNWIWRRSLKFAKFWPLGALPLGPHGGNMCHMNTFESSAPEDDSCQVWLKSNHAFLQEVDETVTFYIGPPPQPVTPHGAIGATLGSATYNLYSSPKKVSTLYTTWLFYLNWIWRRKFEICKVVALWCT